LSEVKGVDVEALKNPSQIKGKGDMTQESGLSLLTPVRADSLVEGDKETFWYVEK
jgi:hypothetical protein